MSRPKLSDFESRKGTWFAVRSQAGEDFGRWILKSIEELEAPDEDGLRDLECFILNFRHEAGEILPQGTYVLASGDDFETTLFASPFRNDEMVVTVN